MKTKTAYVVRYNSNSHQGYVTAGRNLRTRRAALRGVRTLKRLGIKDCHVMSLTVSADSVLRN